MRKIYIIWALLTSLFAGPAVACDGVLIERDTVYTGSVCVPKSPQRIVVFDPSFGLAAALDVGLPVVGAPLQLMSDEALKERAEAKGVASTGFVTEPSLETIVALQPDLIIGMIGSASVASGIYPMASQLAPTLLFTSTDWRNFYRLMAELAGQQDEVAAELAALETRIAGMRDRMPDTTVSVLRITSWDFQVYLDAPASYAPFQLMQDVGVRRSEYETTTDPDLSMKRPDWEELAQLDSDILLYIIGGTNASATDGRHEEVLNNPLWQMLPAVQSGNVHRVAHGHWMQFSGITSAHRVLDDLDRLVVGEN